MFALVLMIILVLGCRLGGSKDGVKTGKVLHWPDNLPTYDPKAPPPSAGAAALRGLAQLEPRVAELVTVVETTEREAMKTLLAKLPAKESTSHDIRFVSPPSSRKPTTVASSSTGWRMDYALFLDGSASDAPVVNTSNDAALIGAIVSGWSDLFTQDVQAGASTSGSATETNGDATSKYTANLGRAADGSTHFGFGSQTEVTKNGITAKTDVAGQVDGQRCPNAEGQVSFTIKIRLGAQSGGTGLTQELTAFVRALVGDDGSITSHTIDVTQGTRQVKAGREVYVETGQTIQNGEKFSNTRVIRTSQQATPADVSTLSQAGHTAALTTALTALRSAEGQWLAGGCTKIEANSPGTVQPNSATKIPVTVRQRFDGSEVPSKLDAGLSGGQSIDPTTLARTSGTLTYTAPGEKGKSATITLTATSRRGRATLALNANTGGQQYTVSGTSGPVTFSGQICSLDKPFVINGTFGNGSETQTFTPSSSTSGTVQESGNSGGCTQSGGGTYKIILNEQGSGTLEFTETVTGVCGSFSNTKTVTFKVSLTPASGLSCP